VNIGQFVTSTDVLFRIVNLEHIHVELQVYEKDVNRISVGQKVTFRLANDAASYSASVYLVGKEISADRTVRIHCHLEKESKTLLPGMFVTAIIDTETEEQNVVPTAAIANYEGREYVFVALGDNQFRAIPVKTGIVTSGFTQIDLLEKIDGAAAIVTTGAFELMGLLKNKQE
jgi:cobalt-zinc-cadmium efflux system membrane fusion protein